MVDLFYLQVIDNDKLTVANLNRIKTLEAQLNESARLVDALENENVELRRAIADENEVRHLALNTDYRSSDERQLRLRTSWPCRCTTTAATT